jgi:hypothetical protein
MWGNNWPPVISGPELTEGLANYHRFAEKHRQQCAAQRARGEEWKSEKAWLDELAAKRAEADETKIAAKSEVRKTDVGNGVGAGLVFKTNPDARVVDAGSEVVRMDGPVLDDDDDADDRAEVLARLTADAAAYATAKTPKLDPYPWWTWVDRNLEYRHNNMIKVLGAVIASERKDMRATVKREGDASKDDFELRARELSVSLHEQVLECGRALREEAKPAREHQEEKDALARYEIGVVRRELAMLREEMALERGFQALKAEIATAKSEIPRLPEIEARVDAKQSRLAAEQARLKAELAKQKDRIGKLRVDQMVADCQLTELRKQTQASTESSISMEFESRSAHFQMKAAHPGAARALKNFATQIIDGHHDGTLWIPGSVSKT